MKNKIFRISVLLLIILFYNSDSFSQFEPAPVEKSAQRIVLHGKTYYIHTVKPGQTLYSICKAYGVTQADIAAANPDISINPLPTGLALKIPVTGNSLPAVTQPSQEKDFIYHTVKPKENIYFLHKKYNIPVEEIYRHNPGTESGDSAGQIVKIPRNFVHNDQQKTDFRGDVIRYTVKEGDTLYRIAKNYGTTISDLINANPDLRWGLKTGQVLVIPPAGILISSDQKCEDSVFYVTPIRKFSKYQCDSIASLKIMRPPVKIALLLPFFASEITLVSDTTDSSEQFIDSARKLKRFRSKASAELYEGALLAIDSLKRINQSISLFVYDTKADTNVMKGIIRDLEIIEPDLIIGPVSPDNIKIASRFSFERKIPLISPFQGNEQQLFPNPYFFRIMPDENVIFQQYAKKITLKNDEKYILVSKHSAETDKNFAYFREQLYGNLKATPGFDTSLFRIVTLDDRYRYNLGKALSKDTINNIIIYATFEPDVINALSYIHSQMRDYLVKVYGFPEWQKYDNVRIDVVHELQVSLYSPFYIDYSDRDVKTFIKKCREKLGYEPYRTSKGVGINYTYLGYDLMMYFAQAMNKYEKNTCNCIEYYYNPQLLSDYLFRNSDSVIGFTNTSISFINYTKDYIVTKTRSEGISY